MKEKRRGMKEQEEEEEREEGGERGRKEEGEGKDEGGETYPSNIQLGTASRQYRYAKAVQSFLTSSNTYSALLSKASLLCFWKT